MRVGTMPDAIERQDPAPPQRSADDVLAEGYLTKLLSYSLESLGNEPSTLASQASALEQELEETSVKHYQTFIAAAQCFHGLKSQVHSVKEQLAKVTGSLDQLESLSGTFAGVAAQYQAGRDSNRSMLRQHTTVLELLEIPQILETCIRNGYYDEALSLVAYTQRTALAVGCPALVSRLVADVEKCRDGLRDKLLDFLSQQITLSDCLRSVSYLRRLGAFSEGELRLRFLECRERWFQGMLEAQEDATATDYARRLSELHRVHLFDVVTQYRAVFSSHHAPAAAGASGGTGRRDTAAVSGGGDEAGRVLASWVHYRVLRYLEKLDGLLALLEDGNTLSGVLEAALYCGRSLARIGLDFRPVLAPVIHSTLHRIFHAHVLRAVAVFSSALESCRWVLMPVGSRPGDGAADGAAEAATSLPAEILAAAHGLMAHPPLAVLFNAMSAAFNTVRATPLRSLFGVAADEVQEAVRQVCGLLVHVPATRTLSPSQTAVYHAMCAEMLNTACPLISRLFKLVFADTKGVEPDLKATTAQLAKAVAEFPSAEKPGGARQPSARTAQASSVAAPPTPSSAAPAPAGRGKAGAAAAPAGKPLAPPTQQPPAGRSADAGAEAPPALPGPTATADAQGQGRQGALRGVAAAGRGTVAASRGRSGDTQHAAAGKAESTARVGKAAAGGGALRSGQQSAAGVGGGGPAAAHAHARQEHEPRKPGGGSAPAHDEHGGKAEPLGASTAAAGSGPDASAGAGARAQPFAGFGGFEDGGDDDSEGDWSP